MTSRRSRIARGCAVLSVLAVAAAGCDGSGFSPGGGGDDDSPETTAAAVVKATVQANVKAGAQGVPVSTLLRVSAVDGTLTSVTVRSKAGKVTGKIVGGSRWVADERLEPGARYRIRAVATSADGTTVESITPFTTQALGLDQQTYPSVAPLQGETVGVGMPVVVTFDLPVTDKAAFEKRMKVTATPQQAGSWRWVSDKEAHWRPRTYWKAGSRVSVAV